MLAALILLLCLYTPHASSATSSAPAVAPSLPPPTCATLAVIRALQTTPCSRVTPAQADAATAHALHCLLSHVGLPAPACLRGADVSRCLAAVPHEVYDAFRGLRARWPRVCTAVAAQNVVWRLEEAVRRVEQNGWRKGAAQRVVRRIRKAEKLAEEMVEAGVEAMREAAAARRAVEEMREGVKRLEDGRERWERREREVAQAVGMVQEVVERGRRGRRGGRDARGDVAALEWTGDAGLVLCAAVRAGWGGAAVVAAVAVVVPLRALSGLMVGWRRVWVDRVVWGLRGICLVVCAVWAVNRAASAEKRGAVRGRGLMRSELERRASVEDTSPPAAEDEDEDEDEEDDLDWREDDWEEEEEGEEESSSQSM